MKDSRGGFFRIACMNYFLKPFKNLTPSNDKQPSMLNFAVKASLTGMSECLASQPPALLRRALPDHPLALCNDGTGAVYYRPDTAVTGTRDKVVLYLEVSVDCRQFSCTQNPESRY